MSLTVTLATTDDQRKLAYAMRRAIFIMEQKLDADLQFDEYDAQPNTYHFLGHDAETGKLVASARCVVNSNERTGKIGRVAVLSECRGKRYGAAIMAAVEKAHKGECDRYVLSAQLNKRTFYEKCGYQRTKDEIYLEMEVEHCMMVKYVEA